MPNNPNPNRIDPTPVRLSTNLSVDRQTPKTDFGDRLKSGLDSTAGAVAQGAAVAAPFIPGGAIVSAAVSSVSTMSNNATPGQTAQASHYMSSSSYALNTTVGNTNNSSTGVGTVNTGSTVNGSASSLPGTGSGGTVGQMNAELIQAQQENAKLMQVQIAMQRENQVFTTVSNVLKTRHDTVKNTISNVR